jgi:hypothetical protein
MEDGFAVAASANALSRRNTPMARRTQASPLMCSGSMTVRSARYCSMTPEGLESRRATALVTVSVMRLHS